MLEAMRKKNFGKLANLWGPPLFWMVLIFAGSSWPSAHVSENQLVDFLAHKAVHLFEYGVLSFLFLRASDSVIIAFFLAFLFGVSDEYHQVFVPGREGRLKDLLVDSLGAALALGLIKARTINPKGLVSCSAEKTKKAARGLKRD